MAGCILFAGIIVWALYPGPKMPSAPGTGAAQDHVNGEASVTGRWGDSYMLVRDKRVIVDQHSGRVAAIVPGMG